MGSFNDDVMIEEWEKEFGEDPQLRFQASFSMGWRV
jgi:hypothetical protein